MVTIRELVAAVLWQWKRVLILTLIFAVLLGGVQAIRVSRAEKQSEGRKLSEYEEELEAYNRELTSLTEKKSSTEKSLALAETYVENSLLMQVDPYNICTYTAIYTVVGEDGQALRKLTDDTIEHTVVMICRNYEVRWTYTDLQDLLTDTAYRNVEEEYFRELVGVNSDNGLLYVTIRAAEEKACEQIFAIVEDFFAKQSDEVAEVTCPHRLMLMEASLFHKADQTLANNQISALNEVTVQQNNLKEVEKELSGLKEPVHVSLSSQPFIKTIAKYLVIGGILGFALGCLLVLWGNIACKRLECSCQAERVLAISFLGNVAAPVKGMKRLSQRINGERVWKEIDLAAAYASERICSSLEDGKQILLAVPGPLDSAHSGLDILVTQLKSKGILARFVKDFNSDPAAVQAMRACDGVVILTEAYRSSLADSARIVSDTENAGKKMLGFVMV